MPATMKQRVYAHATRPKAGPGVAGLIQQLQARRPRARRPHGLGPQNLGRGVLLQNYRPPAAGAPAPVASPALPAAPGPAVAPAPAAPLDARDGQYWGDYTNLKQQRDNQLADIGREGSNALTDREDSINRLIDQRKQSLLNTKRQDAQRGLFYSTTLTNDNRDVNKGYDDQESGVRTAFDRGEAQRAAARRDLELQYGKGDDLGSAGGQLLRDAIQRQIEASLTAPLPDVPEPAAPAAKAAPKPKHKKKKGHH